jgi:hypothetical protein
VCERERDRDIKLVHASSRQEHEGEIDKIGEGN